MLEVQLFLGIEVDENFQKFLSSIKPKMRELFINGNDAYLTTVTHEDSKYIGKYLGNVEVILNLETTELNIHSILKRMDSSFQSFTYPTKLLAILK